MRLVHLGLGHFFQAHQAAYTASAGRPGPTGLASPARPAGSTGGDGLGPDGWGYAAFGGRGSDRAEALAAQGCRYTLVVRGHEVDELQEVDSVVAAHAAADARRWLHCFADPSVGVVTTTVTEAGYLARPGGGADLDSPVLAADVASLRSALTAPMADGPPRLDGLTDRFEAAGVSSASARLVAGLAARWTADAGPIAVVPCDNVPDNGAVLRNVLIDVAEAVEPTLATWIDGSVSVVSTVVDRITPATTEADLEALTRSTGRVDRCAVVTEPFSEWILAGGFPAGRPAWERAGATFVDDVEPFERRKLWLLNGAHSLMAYAGPLRGHATVAEAMADEVVHAWVEQWWEEASRHLLVLATRGGDPMVGGGSAGSPAAVGPGSDGSLSTDGLAADLSDYRAALVQRFANPRIAHHLAQIAADGSQKLPIRVIPTLRAERAAGRSGTGATRVVAAWLCHLRGLGTPVSDPQAPALVAAARGPIGEAAHRVLAQLAPDLADDPTTVAALAELATGLGRR